MEKVASALRAWRVLVSAWAHAHSQAPPIGGPARRGTRDDHRTRSEELRCFCTGRYLFLRALPRNAHGCGKRSLNGRSADRE